MREIATAYIESNPGHTINDLAKAFPDIPRQRLMYGLHNATSAGFIFCVPPSRKGKPKGGQHPAPYYPTSTYDEEEVTPSPVNVTEVIQRVPNSVFQLATHL
jgi:hypothetical protein